jgi:hypothetical protein
MFSAKNVFSNRDLPNFLYMSNTRKCFLRNHFQEKCFSPKYFPTSYRRLTPPKLDLANLAELLVITPNKPTCDSMVELPLQHY